MVWWDSHWVYFLEVTPTQIPSSRETLSIVCHVGIHVKLFIHDKFLWALSLHLRCESEIGRSWFFRPMRDHDQFTWGPKSHVPLMSASPDMEVESQPLSLEKSLQQDL
jgi:hypothetical protein